MNIGAAIHTLPVVNPSLSIWDTAIKELENSLDNRMVESRRDDGPIDCGRLRGVRRIGNVVVVSTTATARRDPVQGGPWVLIPKMHFVCGVLARPHKLGDESRKFGEDRIFFHAGCCTPVTIYPPNTRDLSFLDRSRRPDDGTKKLFDAAAHLGQLLYEEVEDRPKLAARIRSLAAPHELEIREDYLEQILND